MQAGNEIEYDKYFKVIDDIDDISNVDIKINDSKVDLNTPGNYEFVVSATDTSNNNASTKIPLNIYKEYTQSEIKDYIQQLINDKYYDFEYYEYTKEDRDSGYPAFGVSDITGVTDEPSGANHIYGYIDYIVNWAQLRIIIDLEKQNNNEKQIWNKKIIIIF